ncbi:MAG: hypothetical protein WAW37_08035 [Syntrophobacteraceae bacterium]
MTSVSIPEDNPKTRSRTIGILVERARFDSKQAAISPTTAATADA